MLRRAPAALLCKQNFLCSCLNNGSCRCSRREEQSMQGGCRPSPGLPLLPAAAELLSETTSRCFFLSPPKYSRMTSAFYPILKPGGEAQSVRNKSPSERLLGGYGMSFSSRELEFSSQDPTRSSSRGSFMPLWSLRIPTRMDIDIK